MGVSSLLIKSSHWVATSIFEIWSLIFPISRHSNSSNGWQHAGCLLQHVVFCWLARLRRRNQQFKLFSFSKLQAQLSCPLSGFDFKFKCNFQMKKWLKKDWEKCNWSAFNELSEWDVKWWIWRQAARWRPMEVYIHVLEHNHRLMKADENTWNFEKKPRFREWRKTNHV